MNLPRRSRKKRLKAQRALPCSQLNAEGAAAAAGALHIGIVELEPRAFNRLDVIDFNSVQIHGAHLVYRDLQSVELKNLFPIRLLVSKHPLSFQTSPPSPAH